MPSANRRQFGNVRKLPSGKYQASYWHIGVRHVAPRTYATNSDANVWQSSVETDIARRTWTDPSAGKVTVAEWLESWPATVVDGRVESDNTRAGYARTVRLHLVPALGEVCLDRLSPEMVDRFLMSKAFTCGPPDDRATADSCRCPSRTSRTTGDGAPSGREHLGRRGGVLLRARDGPRPLERQAHAREARIESILGGTA